MLNVKTTLIFLSYYIVLMQFTINCQKFYSMESMKVHFLIFMALVILVFCRTDLIYIEVHRLLFRVCHAEISKISTQMMPGRTLQ